MEGFNLKPGTNTGVIIDVRQADFYAGGETGVNNKPILSPEGQYDIYLPDEEAQYKNIFDVYACVSFSAANCLEILFNKMLSAGTFSQKQTSFLKTEGYLDPMTGKVNFSDRQIAKASGTTQGGNSLGAVGDAIRKTAGLVPEKDWAWPISMSDDMSIDEKWALYYQPIPQAVKDKGLRFLNHFNISYQWIVLEGKTADPLSVIKQYLPYGPIQAVTSVCSPWNSTEANPPIKGCGCGTQHAHTIYGYNEGQSIKDFDSYKSYRKLLAWDYCIPYAVQYYVSEIKDIPASPFKHVYNVNLRFGDPASAEVTALQKGLQTLKDKDGVPYMNPGVFGPFGPQTKQALAKFQIAHLINDPDGPGTNFGLKSREALTALLNK